MKTIIAGSGQTLYFVCKTFLAKGHHVTVIDPDRNECVMFARRTKARVIHGDASDPAILDDAEILGTDLILALTPKDQDNLVICQLAEIEYGVPRTLALVNDPDNEKIFSQLGVRAFSITPILSSLIEQRATLDQITNLLPLGEGRVSLAEVRLTEESPAVDKTLQELDLPLDSLLACIIRGDRTIVPRGPTRLAKGDRVILIASPENYGALLKAVTGEA